MSVYSIISSDLFRYNGKTGIIALFVTFLRKPYFRFLVLWRLHYAKPSILLRLLLAHSTNHTHIEIGWKTKIGKGLLLVHPSGIAVNNDCVIGKNCTLYGGVTLGMEFRDDRLGSPILGDSVWAGPNAVIVGKIHIGDDCLIAPNAFVNFNVPPHSIVVGNPGKIVSQEHATKGYIIRAI